MGGRESKVGGGLRIAVCNAARHYGGQEAVAALLATALCERGHDVLFLCRPVFPALDRLRAAGVPVAAVLSGIDWDPLSILRARRALRHHCARVLLVTSNKDMRSAGAAAASARVPIVVRRAMARPLRDNLQYRLLYGRLPAHIVVNSETTAAIVRETAPWVDTARLSVIYNGIDVDRFSAAEPADLGVPPDALTIGFVGRFINWKGVLDLAGAWPRVAEAVPAAHLVWVGEGVMEPAMRERLGDAPRVHWAGFRDDVPAVMRVLDILAFPSTMEGFGFAAAEAMAAGVPVVGADAASLPEVIGDAGVLVPPRDPSALAHALIALARDPDRRRRLGEIGRARAERLFRRDRMIEAYETLLDRVARGVGESRVSSRESTANGFDS